MNTVAFRTAQICFSLALLLLLIHLVFRKCKTTKNRKVFAGTAFVNGVHHLLKKLPVFSLYYDKVCRRIELISALEENEVKQKAVNICGGTFLISCVTVLFSAIFINTFASSLVALIMIVLMWGVLIEFCINHDENKLLENLDYYLTYLRTQYYETRRVDDAFQMTNYNCPIQDKGAMRRHGEAIFDALGAPNGQESIREYYTRAPNQYLKLLACISFMTMEFGDHFIEESSAFAKGISFISQELRSEVSMRNKLNVALKSLNYIALAPLLCLSPIKEWASSSFYPLKAFYNGALGFIAEIIVLSVVTISFIMLTKVQNTYENIEMSHSISHEMVQIPIWLEDILSFAAPLDETAKGKRIKHKIESALISRSLQKHYALKMMSGICLGLIFTLVVAVAYLVERHNVERILAETDIGIDIQLLDWSQNQGYPLIDDQVIQAYISRFQVNELRQRDLFEQVSNSEFKKHLIRINEVFSRLARASPGVPQAILTLIAAVLGWILPDAFLMLQLSSIKTQTNTEIGRFQMIVMVLMHIPHIDTFDILVWLEQFSFVYRFPLRKAIMDYDSGAMIAVSELGNFSNHPEFKKLIFQLSMCVESLTVYKAFEDLVNEKAYFMERREMEKSNLVNQKIHLGQWIGFAPIYTTLFFYFMVPMVYASITEMQVYFMKLSS